MGYKVVAHYPHSTDSYTEGFFYLDGLFYEGTGIAGHSALFAIQPETGNPVQKRELAPQYFGEGIVDWGPTSTSGRGRRKSALFMTASAFGRLSS